MRLLLAVAALCAIAVVAALFTRPGPEQFDAMLRAELAERVAAADVATAGDTVATVALIGCKLSPSTCFDTVRALLDVRFDEGVFVTLAEVHGLAEGTCIGAFNRFWCKKGLIGS
jgi:hypothetical protein